MFTMWPWRMRCLFTTSLICMREPSSPRWVCAQKILTWDVRKILENDLRHVGERRGA